jgi:hypothetical protein
MTSGAITYALFCLDQRVVLDPISIPADDSSTKLLEQRGSISNIIGDR